MCKIAPTLYHGTTRRNAKALLKNGWKPNEVPVGSNDGRRDYLYLSTVQNDANFYGYMNDEYEHVVLKVKDVPLAALEVDIEDSQLKLTVEKELEMSKSTGFPGKLVLTRALPAAHFSRLKDSA